MMWACCALALLLGDGDSTPQPDPEDALIDLATADTAALMELPNMTQSTAEKIVRFRGEHGAFIDAESLQHIDGISDADILLWSPWFREPELERATKVQAGTVVDAAQASEARGFLSLQHRGGAWQVGSVADSALQVDQAFAAHHGAYGDAIFGSYQIGFGERLTFDRGRLQRPQGGVLPTTAAGNKLSASPSSAPIWGAVLHAGVSNSDSPGAQATLFGGYTSTAWLVGAHAQHAWSSRTRLGITAYAEASEMTSQGFVFSAGAAGMHASAALGGGQVAGEVAINALGALAAVARAEWAASRAWDVRASVYRVEDNFTHRFSHPHAVRRGAKGLQPGVGSDVRLVLRPMHALQLSSAAEVTHRPHVRGKTPPWGIKLRQHLSYTWARNVLWSTTANLTDGATGWTPQVRSSLGLGAGAVRLGVASKAVWTRSPMWFREASGFVQLLRRQAWQLRLNGGVRWVGKRDIPTGFMVARGRWQIGEGWSVQGRYSLQSTRQILGFAIEKLL